jgi:tetratricopeptide (TPR) repeat protein
MAEMSKVATSPVGSQKLRAVAFLVLVVLAGGGLMALFWPAPDAESLAQRARGEFMARRFDLAGADLDRVFRLRAPTPLDWMLHAQLSMAKGRNEEALEDLAKVPDDHPMAAQSRLQAGQIELRRSRYRPAEASFLQAIKLDPKLERARRELVYIYGMQLRRPELNAAFAALSRISALSYSEVFLWSLSRGVSWEADELVETLRKCIEADPDDRWARIGRAEGLRELARFDEAEAVLTPLPESDPVARATRVRIALDRGDDQAADTLLAGGPADDLNLALLRGRFALARGNGPEAIRQFRIAHDRAPNLREAVLGLGQALKTTGDLAAAAPLLEEARRHERLGSLVQKAAVLKNRDDPALMRDLGEACAALGRNLEARAWYNLAITKDPLDTQAQQALARLKEAEDQARAKDKPPAP